MRGVSCDMFGGWWGNEQDTPTFRDMRARCVRFGGLLPSHAKQARPLRVTVLRSNTNSNCAYTIAIAPARAPHLCINTPTSTSRPPLPFALLVRCSPLTSASPPPTPQSPRTLAMNASHSLASHTRCHGASSMSALPSLGCHAASATSSLWRMEGYSSSRAWGTGARGLGGGTTDEVCKSTWGRVGG